MRVAPPCSHHFPAERLSLSLSLSLFFALLILSMMDSFRLSLLSLALLQQPTNQPKAHAPSVATTLAPHAVLLSKKLALPIPVSSRPSFFLLRLFNSSKVFLRSSVHCLLSPFQFSSFPCPPCGFCTAAIPIPTYLRRSANQPTVTMVFGWCFFQVTSPRLSVFVVLSSVPSPSSFPCVCVLVPFFVFFLSCRCAPPLRSPLHCVAHAAAVSILVNLSLVCRLSLHVTASAIAHSHRYRYRYRYYPAYYYSIAHSLHLSSHACLPSCIHSSYPRGSTPEIIEPKQMQTWEGKTLPGGCIS